MNKFDYEIEQKENVYFTFKVIFGIIGYILFYIIIKNILSSDNYLTFVPILIYIPIILIFLFLRMGLLIGYLKGNSVKVTARQFPDIYEIVKKQSAKLDIHNIPDVYVLQNGGLLNAFATRFVGNNYIVLYSDIIEEAYNNNGDALEFIIGHELGHIKRKHMIKSVIFFPSFFIPFLNRAYSRACEYTCDSIGASLQPTGAKPGILMLAAGKRIWEKVDSEEFMLQEKTEIGFWSWFAEKISTHPKMTKRLMRFKHLKMDNKVAPIESASEVRLKERDHSAYMPKY